MKSKILVVGLFSAALISLLLYIFFRQYAFPEHAIQFQITEQEAEHKAEDLAQQGNFGLQKYRKSTTFEIDDTAKSYLERELGAKKTGELAKTDVTLWYFTTRLFQTLEQEELYVSFAPDGRLVSFTHEIAEDRAGSTLDKTTAQQIAETFIASNCQLCVKTGFPQEWNIVQYGKTQRKNRLDHTFVFERKNYALKDARQRVRVQLAGDQVIQFTEYVKVPQAWISQFNKEKSYNNVAQVVAELVSLLCITLPIIYLFFKKLKSKKLLFKIPYRVAIIISIVTLGEMVNNFYQYYFQYPTTQSNTTILITVIFGLIVAWIYSFVSTEATLATAEGVFREEFPTKKSTMYQVQHLFTTPSTTKGIFIGACIGIIFFMYELAYYFLGQKIGFWVPADVNYSDAFNSVAPWLYPLTIGLLPAISEEVTYRLFGISLYHKFFSRWIKNPKVSLIVAAILASLSWSFLHSGYPQMPFFVRGVELAFVGFAFSWLFLRYGILSSIAAHYSFNALQMAIFFLDSKSLFASISSLIVALLPFWIVLISLLVQKVSNKRITEADIPLNEQTDPLIPVAVPSIKPPEQINLIQPSEPLTRKTKILLVLACIVSLTLLEIRPQHTSSDTSNDTSFINRNDALHSAQSFLNKINVSTDTYLSVATVDSLGGDSDAQDYLDKNSDPSTSQYFLNKNKEPQKVWNIRFFRPQQKEEYTVKLWPDGKVYTYTHTLDEKAPGALLSEQEAQDKAHAYLQQQVTGAGSFHIINSENLKRDNRNDYRFTFEDSERVANASRRISIDVIDAQAQNLQNYIKLPEVYQRETEQISTKQLLLSIGGTLFTLTILVLLSSTLFKLYKEGKLKNPVGLAIAALAITFGILSQINHFSIFFSGYDTDLPVWVYTTFQVIEIPISIALTFIFTVLTINAGAALYQKYFGPLLPEALPSQKRLFSNALFLVCILSTIGVCILYASENIAQQVFPSTSTASSSGYLSTPDDIETWFPVVEGFKNITRPIIAFFAIIVCLGTMRMAARSWRNLFILVAVLGLIIFFTTEWRTRDLFAGLVTFVPVILYTTIAWKYIVKNNIFFYILTIYYILVGFETISFLSEKDTFLILNGVAYLGFALLPFIIWPLYEPITKAISRLQGAPSSIPVSSEDNPEH